jgi:hypothetical protein
MNDFERVSDEVSTPNYETSSECAIEWVRGNRTATVTFPSANRYNSKVRRLAEEYPEEVKIRHENLDGSIVATIPVKFIKIGAPKKVSDEQREALSERLRQIREKQNYSLPVDANTTGHENC